MLCKCNNSSNTAYFNMYMSFITDVWYISKISDIYQKCQKYRIFSIFSIISWYFPTMMHSSVHWVALGNQGIHVDSLQSHILVSVFSVCYRFGTVCATSHVFPVIENCFFVCCLMGNNFTIQNILCTVAESAYIQPCP